MKKKLSAAFALILAVCILMTQAVCFTAFADSEEVPSIVVSSASAKAGDTVDVTITMSGNPGFVSANLYVNYDTEVLTLKEVTDGGLLSGVTHSDNYVTSPYGLCWANDTAKENFTVNGVLATLKFEVSSEAVSGTSTISLSQDILNYDMDNVEFNLVSGEVQIEGKHIHAVELVAAKESTCTENGHSEYYYCAGCGKSFKDAEATEEISLDAVELPLKAHQGGEATCTQQAVCDICGNEYGDYAEHKYVEDASEKFLKTPATCTSKAVYYKSCSVCGFASETETFEYGELADHSYDTAWKSDKTSHWHECTSCGDKIDVAEHTSSGPATEEEAEVCTECGYVITPALGHTHNLTLVEEVPATCTEDGHKAYYICDGCGKMFEDGTASVEITDPDSVIIKAGHTPSEWIVDKEATATESGSKHKECVACGEILETEEIAPVSEPTQPTEPSTVVDEPTEPSTVDEPTEPATNGESTPSEVKPAGNGTVQTGDSNIAFALVVVLTLCAAAGYAFDSFRRRKRG